MTKSAHSPGPWTAEANGGDDSNPAKLFICARDVLGHTHMLAECEPNCFVDDEPRGEANALLIASAPDFKEAALMAMAGRACSATEIAISKGAWCALRDAIAKSEGDE